MSWPGLPLAGCVRYPKSVISMDTAFGGDLEGIRRVNLAEFLLEDY